MSVSTTNTVETTIISKFKVAPSPHFKSNVTTQSIMRDVLIALAPSLVVSIFVFGFRALLLTLVCGLSCIIFEYLYNKINKTPQRISDLSAVVTGVLLAFNLPVTIPFYIAIIGCFAAIVIVKQLFGGIGKNFVNPAITARIILFVSFAKPMSNWVIPVMTSGGIDTVSGATPLALISNGDLDQLPSVLELFIGLKGGCIGEVSALALLIGGSYLVFKRIISPLIPFTYFATVIVFSLVVGVNPVYQLLTGGLMLGAIFMATDYSTTPITNKGKFIFAIGCGIITMVIRIYGSYPEGVSFAILLMNIIAPLIDQYTATKPFGTGGKIK